jgi:hypothetical protein
MISIERCKEILGQNIPDAQVQKTRDALYAMVESILDNYFEEFATITPCKKQLYTVEYPQPDKAQKDTASIAKSTVVENMLHKRAMRS